MINYIVKNRYTGEVQFTARVDFTADANKAQRLGLAVKWAIVNGADLYGADLRGADLYGANIKGGEA